MIDSLNSQLNGNICKYTKVFDINGIESDFLEKITEYKFGKKTGKELEFFRNKNIKKKVFYLMDNLHGLYTEYFENCFPKKKIEYWYGKKNGKYKEWYINGTLKKECFYNMDILDKTYKEFLYNGKLLYNILYENGNIISNNLLDDSMKNHFFYKSSPYKTYYTFRYNYIDTKNIYENDKLYKKIIYYPFSYRIKTEITYFPDGTIQNKNNFNLIGQFDGIQITWHIYKNIKYIKKQIRYRDGLIISEFNDNETIFKNNKNISILSPPNTDLIVWKKCYSNDSDSFNIPVLLKLLIPKKVKRLLFIDNNLDLFHSRAECCIIKEIISLNSYKKNIKEAYSLSYNNISKKFIYKLGDTIKDILFNSDINNINGNGIYYNIDFDDAQK